MIYWDTSAIVPLVIDEPHSESVRAVLRNDGNVVVWWMTTIECLSAILRNEREGRLTREQSDQARQALDALGGDWSELAPSETVRDRARGVLMRHPLRAVDALQLGAALTWTEGQPLGHRFLTLDERLAAAARAEGFDVTLDEGSSD